MQLSFSFSTLLAGVLVALFAHDVQAVPVQPRMVTLPLKRMEHRSNAHPQILLQQQINRASKRLALMSGRQAPTSNMMTDALRKRVLAVEGQAGLERRFNRHGVPDSEKRFNRYGVKKTKIDKRRKNKHGGASGADGNGGGDASGADGTGDNTGAGAAGSGAGTGAGVSSEIGGPDSVAGVEVANAPSADNSLALDNETPDIGYLATVQMGTPPQNYLILMDSGSADLWVASEDCKDCGQHQTLGTQSSSTFTDSGSPFSVTYGTGSVSGDIVTDDITVAGLTLKAHTFGVATQETDDFSADTVPFDGLMGLAQSTLSQQQTATPVEALAAQGLIADAITSYKISRSADNLNDGEITFGALDSTKFDAATLVTTPNVNQQGFWEAAMDDVTVDGQSVGLDGRTAILDTGTTLIVAPQADAEAVHNLITGSTSDGQGGFTVPCTFNQSVALTFGGSAFAIDPRDIAAQPVNANDPTGDCVSGISGGSFGTSDTEWLVGDVFLKNAYYSTDVGKNQISLAKLV